MKETAKILIKYCQAIREKSGKKEKKAYQVMELAEGRHDPRDEYLRSWRMPKKQLG